MQTIPVICRFAILAITLLLSSNYESRVLYGRIYASVDQQFYNVNNVSIVIYSQSEVIDTVQTNANGEFLAVIPVGISSNVDLYYYGVGFEKNYLGHIGNLKSDTIRFETDLAKKYRKSVFGKAYCLKCGKLDMVYRIRYGDAPVYTAQVTEDGDTLSSIIRNGVYEAGTCVSSAQSARWYCDRDKITIILPEFQTTRLVNNFY